MNTTTFYKSVNLQITKDLNTRDPIFYQNFSDDEFIIIFSDVCAIVPKDILTVDVSKLSYLEWPDFTDICNKIQNVSRVPFDEVERLGKHHFIGSNYLYFVEGFGDFKGLTFGRAAVDIIDDKRYIVLSDDLHKPRVILVCQSVWRLSAESRVSLSDPEEKIA